MNINLFAGHLLKVTLLMIGTRLLISFIPVLVAITIPQENFLFSLTSYSYWVANLICAIALIYFMGKIRSASVFVGLLAIISPGLAGIFSLFLNLEQFKK